MLTKSNYTGTQSLRFLAATALTLLSLVFSFPCLSVRQDSLSSKNYQEKVGLVLSGGGAKGIAHVGVIKALEENDIPIDYVAGTSMGAIVGSLYSCGWSPEKMMEFFTSSDFGYWSTGVINPDNTYFFNRALPSPKWISLNLNPKDTTALVEQIIPTCLISPLPMNMEFLRLYSPYTKQIGENFNNLMVPFRCVTSDVYHKHKIVLRDGSLGDAVRASMSFPLVFKPIKLNGILVYDGGIYDNFPVDVMRDDFHPDFIIGVSVSSPDKKPQEGNVYSQLEDMIIQNNDYSLPAKEGVKIQVPVLDFGVLDFGQARTIYNIGYKTGLAMVDSIKSRCHARRPLADVSARRERFADNTPVVMFDSVKVTGAKKDEAKYLRFLFDKGKNIPFDMQQTQNAYYRAVTGGKLSNLLPQAIFEKDGETTLLLEADVKKPWSVGVGGWVTTSTNSMLYMTLGYHTLNFNSLDVDLSGWVGQSYWAGKLEGKFTMRSAIPSYMALELVLSRQKFYDSELLFYQEATPSFITENDNFLRLRYCWAMGRRAEGYASLGGGYISDSYYPDNTIDFADAFKDKTKYKVLAFMTGFKRATLDNDLYPNAGMEFDANILLSYEHNKLINKMTEGDERYKKQMRGSLEILWKHFYPLHHHFSLGFSTQGLGTLQKINQNYTAALVHAAAFAPTPSTRYYFNEAFRSDNYLAAGLMPIWLPFSKLQLRGDFYVYSPIRRLVRETNDIGKYKGWFPKAEFIGEVAAVYNFPFASLSVYCNYLSSPSRNWNFGINFGLLFHAPRLLR